MTSAHKQIALCLAVVAALVAGSARADEVVTRLAPHDGYGRIVFNWPVPVPFSARRDGDRLIVTFQRPADLQFIHLIGANIKTNLVNVRHHCLLFSEQAHDQVGDKPK